MKTQPLPHVLHVIVLTLTMTLSSATSGSLSIFKDGKLKPGIYKIQNLYAQTYTEIHEHSREACCRRAGALEEGKGLVRPFQWSMVRISDDKKWEIKPLGAGYSVRRVSVPICIARPKNCTFNDEGPRLSRASPTSFVFQYTGWETELIHPSGLPHIP